VSHVTCHLVDGRVESSNAAPYWRRYYLLLAEKAKARGITGCSLAIITELVECRLVAPTMRPFLPRLHHLPSTFITYHRAHQPIRHVMVAKTVTPAVLGGGGRAAVDDLKNQSNWAVTGALRNEDHPACNAYHSSYSPVVTNNRPLHALRAEAARGGKGRAGRYRRTWRPPGEMAG